MRLSTTSILLFWLSGCSLLTAILDEKDTEELATEQDTSLIFSHNIHGELTPCGCPHYPLGGLAQVAGVINTLGNYDNILYVDSGDTLFAETEFPASLTESKTFNGYNLARGLERLGLHYFLPGDQDFAAGMEFLQKIARERKFNFLMSNLRDAKKIKHKSWAIVQRGRYKIFLMGVLSPELLPAKYAGDFLPIIPSLKKIIKTLKRKGLRPKSPHHRLVLLSHSGIEKDQQLALQFPEIDWIIGAHTQDFTRTPKQVGNTRIVQVLSKNHYLGKITFKSNAKQKMDSYTSIEVGHEMQDKLKPNPFISFIDRHRTQMAKIQQKEQEAMIPADYTDKRMTTAASCIDCHSQPGDKWLQTPHALAYATLINVKEENNLSCVKCHSVGLGNPQGFQNIKDMVAFDDNSNKNKYFAAVKELISSIKSVRQLSPHKTQKLAQQWIDLEKKHGVSHNFSNVQCLNCHSKDINHPFETTDEEKTDSKTSLKQMKNNCLSCHDRDQSPQWYKADTPDWKVIDQKTKAISCSR